MAAILEIENDAGVAITSTNFGAVDSGDDQELQFQVKNVGTANATSVQIVIQQLASNDGINYVQLAEDFSGNPGAYSPSAIVVGTLIPGAIKVFWVKVTAPSGASPTGNPRQFNLIAQYTGV